MSANAHAHSEDHHEDHGHHHKETFVTKYIFSQDHKMIAKQYLISAGQKLRAQVEIYHPLDDE
ncbi:MAG TPA: hypothetical protein DCE59_07615 [Gammaproteobacteria bacterium]|nr:hypothetical protein [Gammaproteobacteria bacterium]